LINFYIYFLTKSPNSNNKYINHCYNINNIKILNTKSLFKRWLIFTYTFLTKSPNSNKKTRLKEKNQLWKPIYNIILFFPYKHKPYLKNLKEKLIWFLLFYLFKYLRRVGFELLHTSEHLSHYCLYRGRWVWILKS